MIHNLYFPPLGGGSALTFIWHPESGTISGESQGIILDLISQALEDGFVISHPWPTVYKIKDPLHNLAEMAAIVGSWHVLLPPEWAAALEPIAPLPDESDLSSEEQGIIR